MSLAARIALGCLILAVLLGVSSLFQLAIVDELEATNAELAAVDVEGLSLGFLLWSRLAELEDFVEKFLVLEDARYRLGAERVAEEIERDLVALQGLELSPAESEHSQALVDAWVRSRRESGLSAETLDALQDVRRHLASFQQTAREEMRLAAEESAARARRARRLAWGATGLGMLLAVLIGFVLARSAAGPLRRLVRGTQELGRGRFEHRVPAAGPPELARLAEAFNRMSERLGELDRLKQDLVSNVSHDLKAPLASMQETTRLLLDEVPGELNARQRRLLGLTLESGRRLTEMITNLLDLSRLEAGAVSYRFAPCDLGELVKETVAEVSAEIERKGLSVASELPPEGTMVEADASLLSRAVANLLSNAVKFSPEGGTIGIRVSTPASETEIRKRLGRVVPSLAAPVVLCEVWDSGPGIPDAHKEKVFDRFHRADERQRGDQSTGLGLAITRSIVEGHGGRVWVEDRPGGGSRFFMVLECAKGSSESESPRRDVEIPSSA